MASASSSASGRRTILAALPPASATSSTTAFSSLADPDASSNFEPSAPSATAQAWPKDPEAPVIITTLSRTSKSDSGLRNLSLIISRASLAGFDAETLFRVENGDYPHATALALRPAPGKRHEGAALAGDRIELAVDVLNARNTALAHHDFVRRLPMRKILHRIASGFAPVFFQQMRM